MRDQETKYTPEIKSATSEFVEKQRKAAQAILAWGLLENPSTSENESREASCLCIRVLKTKPDPSVTIKLSVATKREELVEAGHESNCIALSMSAVGRLQLVSKLMREDVGRDLSEYVLLLNLAEEMMNAEISPVMVLNLLTSCHKRTHDITDFCQDVYSDQKEILQPLAKALHGPLIDFMMEVFAKQMLDPRQYLSFVLEQARQHGGNPDVDIDVQIYGPDQLRAILKQQGK